MKFMRYRIFYFLFSAVFLLPSIWSLVNFGLKPSIDFTGGSLLELSIKPKEDVKLINESEIRNLVGDEYDLSSIQFTDQNTLIIRSQPLTQEEKHIIVRKIEDGIGELQELRFETVGPIIGKELLKKTTTAIIIASILILFFVAYRFNEIKYGVCAILAMFHDTLILLGTFSLLGHFLGVEVDTLFVTAVLTTLSFSVHDTIVVYDRIRESLKRYSRADFEDIINLAVAETLGRSLNNSFTIIFMLTALLLFGGITVRWFVLALLIGTVSGTYSSTFTAAPLLVLWENRFKKNKKQ